MPSRWLIAAQVSGLDALCKRHGLNWLPSSGSSRNARTLRLNSSSSDLSLYAIVHSSLGSVKHLRPASDRSVGPFVPKCNGKGNLPATGPLDRQSVETRAFFNYGGARSRSNDDGEMPSFDEISSGFPFGDGSESAGATCYRLCIPILYPFLPRPGIGQILKALLHLRRISL